MTDGEAYKRAGTLLVLLFLTFAVWWPEFFEVSVGSGLGASISEFLGEGSCPKGLLCVVFLDVGQGDSIFIQSPSGTQMLVDGGRDSSVLRELGTVMGFWDREIDYVLATHPDADHIGGLSDVMERYEVSDVIRTENESKTPDWQAFESGVKEEGAKVFYARRGQVFDLGSGTTLEILFPDIDASELESNTASIVARLVYEKTSFMLTGDSPKAIEEYLVLVEGENLDSDVLKVGHHGSRTSTSELFLDHISPTYVVISAGRDNQYGHPHMEVTDMLFNKRVETHSTAEEGRITFVSNGDELSLK
jgi:competence protein ComEC